MNHATRTLFATLLAAVAVAPAFADPGGRGHGHGHGRGDDGDRYVYADRFGDGPAGCPPGLAKKHNGCTPPGQARKMRREPMVGHHLPPRAVYVVPQRVRATLPRPPAGYRYAIVDDQVVLVSNTNIVVDVIRSILG